MQPIRIGLRSDSRNNQIPMTTTTPPPPTIDFAQVRSRCPKAFAALITWFCQGKAFDRPLTIETPQYDGLLSGFDTWIDLRDAQFSAGDFRRVYTLNPRDLFDFFDQQGLFVNTRMDYLGRELKVVWGYTLEHVSDSESPGELISCPYPTRPAAEAAAFTAGFEKLEEIKQKEG